MVLGNLKGLIDLNDKEIATLRLTASLAMTGIFRQPENGSETTVKPKKPSWDVFGEF